jgi:hypothetical protein
MIQPTLPSFRHLSCAAALLLPALALPLSLRAERRWLGEEQRALPEHQLAHLLCTCLRDF